ncbi:helix-turn-helix transcriptional regulator [Streptomyces sp. WI04-05B]|uniref:Regulatory protein n=1 Tax=Streptomyces turgidiscabies (strain Car8) TaxID=698760 RepID=L7F5Z0_STRT8|nr:MULTISPECIES: helix-turn-helix transcriptional regulator [Streptomyces]ELP66055.1 regulatory protein [Streptomyces turgidiscabies Car8]MDX2547586.1 helix-turn-helix transcriptional regulator [Streptomyces sp. WI04-05B]MDX2589979.1 helix-turn-helix transcriptional regulator [Streptomyces sp. WI04-05A]MDX3499852.1 helix-turn-helix transcriptional regulator [Streptomyces turgidiscabies]GAQ75977.1 55.5 kDa and 49.5 kDa sporulation proteins [Streptomyces turgidiscabies]
MPQPEKTLDPGASPREWFGYQLRKHRKINNLSARQLGRLVQVSDDMILSIEHGKYPICHLHLAERFDDVLGTGDLFTEAWPMVFGAADADKKSPDADKRRPKAAEVAVPGQAGRMLESDTPSPSGSPAPVDRRAFLANSSLAAIASIDLVALVAPRDLPQPPTRIRRLDIEQILTVADEIHRLDNMRGGGGLIGVLAGHAMQWAVGRLTVPCPGQLQAPLYSAVARLGIVVGASHFDAYAHDDARVAFKVAAECAEEARDWHLRAKVYSFLARQAIWVGDPDTGLTYAEKGLVRSDRLTPRIQAMLHSARARAFGKMGDVRGTLAAVGAADDAFGRSNPDEDPSWMAYYNQAQHHGDTAHAFWDLAILVHQDPARASQRFSIAVAGHSDDYARSRAISGTKWAGLLMAKGDPCQAAAIGEVALDDAGHLTSRRTADDLAELGRFAKQHRGLPEVERLRERIAVTLQV